MNQTMTPTITAGIPSRMNSQRHPSSPALPLRKEMAVARRPPKAPATAMEEANMAIRVARSSGLYQKQRYIMIPGKKPASARPRKKRTDSRPA